MFKYINGLTFSNLDITAVKETHSYNTRSKNNLRLPKVKRNWGKQRLAYPAGNDWNSLNENIRNSENILQFKISFGKRMFECVYVCVTLCLISYIFTYHNYVTYVSYLFCICRTYIL